jgi:hypothetical protein
LFNCARSRRRRLHGRPQHLLGRRIDADDVGGDHRELELPFRERFHHAGQIVVHALRRDVGVRLAHWTLDPVPADLGHQRGGVVEAEVRERLAEGNDLPAGRTLHGGLAIARRQRPCRAERRGLHELTPGDCGSSHNANPLFRLKAEGPSSS